MSSAAALESVAVALAVAYVVLAMRQNIWCWAAALASTAIYIVLFFDVSLYMESALQIFYLAMAVYGWWRWRGAGGPDDGLPVTRRPWRWHLGAVLAVLALSAASGYALEAGTDAALPYLDSLTTWGAVVTTWMVTAKILENWLYWVVIDLASIYLYLERGLLQTAGLFVLYVVLAIGGYLLWRADWRERRAEPAMPADADGAARDVR